MLFSNGWLVWVMLGLFVSTQELLERIDYLETIVGIRKGLDEFERGEGIPANQALATLQQKYNIPPRS